MKTPTLVILDPLQLKDQLQAAPDLQALLGEGYTVADVLVLVRGAEGEETSRLGLIMVPPQLSPALSLPKWAPWCVGAGLALLAVLAALLAVLLATGGVA